MRFLMTTAASSTSYSWTVRPRRRTVRPTTIKLASESDRRRSLADRGYDADWIRAHAAERGAWANVPPRCNRKEPICFSPYLYRARNLVERFFNRIKHCRRVATRYDKLAANYLAFIQLASIRLWLRVNESLLIGLYKPPSSRRNLPMRPSVWRLLTTQKVVLTLAAGITIGVFGTLHSASALTAEQCYKHDSGCTQFCGHVTGDLRYECFGICDRMLDRC